MLIISNAVFNVLMRSLVLLGAQSVRKALKLWDISGDGRFWKVELDVRDPGGHLYFTDRAGAGTLSCRVKEATAGVATVGALPLGFQVKLGLVRGKYIPAGLHAAEALMCLHPRIVPFGLPLSWRCAPIRCLLANTPAVLNLLDGPVGVDPALHVIWVRFRKMRRYIWRTALRRFLGCWI